MTTATTRRTVATPVDIIFATNDMIASRALESLTPEDSVDDNSLTSSGHPTDSEDRPMLQVEEAHERQQPRRRLAEMLCTSSSDIHPELPIE